VVAEARHPDFQAIGPVAHGTPQFPPHSLQGYRLQALHLAAGLALEMGVGRMVLAGQFKVGGAALHGYFAHQAQPYKVFQDAVNADFVDRTPGPHRVQDFPGLPGAFGGPEDFQNLEAQSGGPDIVLGQHLSKIAMIAHNM